MKTNLYISLNANIKKTNFTRYQHKMLLKKKKQVFYNFLEQSSNASTSSLGTP